LDQFKKDREVNHVMSNNTVKRRPLAQGMNQTDLARYAGYKKLDKAGARMTNPLVIDKESEQGK
jgi:hypothetical protein